MEYIFKNPWVKWVFIRGGSFYLVGVGLYCVISGITNPTEPDANFAIFLGLITVGFGIFYLWIMKPKIAQSSLFRGSEKKDGRKRSSKKKLEI